MVERYIAETTVGRLAVRMTGAGQVVVCWPSLFVDDRSLEPLATRLATDRRVVVINGPGHGGSGDPGHRYSQRICAAAAGEVLDQLAISDPVDWVGNAWGGHVGLVLAASRPTRVHSLITIGSPVAQLSPAERRRTWLLLGIYQLFGPVELVLSGVTEALLSAHTRAGNPAAVTLVRDSLRHADRRMLGNAVRSISLNRDDVTDLLPSIAAPTLMITGSDHAGFTPAQASAAARLLPDGRAAVVADAAYLVPLESPERTAALIRDFWAECSGRPPASTAAGATDG